ncbi:hypothetical protein [Methyloradius palustris]|uniref:Uncharacterized protein n=1 Tax=Methyloradius palustris TaxID=2778876 RepID=A0A8D5G8M1_9PROT|nr:hypothetical protein [Methyloradius palustris]BCM25162.1 hypothetical protein ZMTM_14210 [Methyloradius palustris]
MEKYTYTLDLDVDQIPFYSKLEIAEHQLEQAARLYLDEGDYISAITLAGASDELIRELLNRQGKKSELDNYADTVLFIGKTMGEKWAKKEIIDDANYYRNHLKHFKDGESISITRDSASQIIDRVVTNFQSLTGKQNITIDRYIASRGY